MIVNKWWVKTGDLSAACNDSEQVESVLREWLRKKELDFHSDGAFKHAPSWDKRTVLSGIMPKSVVNSVEAYWLIIDLSWPTEHYLLDSIHILITYSLLLSLTSSRSNPRLLPRLLVTYIFLSIFPSVTCFRCHQSI